MSKLAVSAVGGAMPANGQDIRTAPSHTRRGALGAIAAAATLALPCAAAAQAASEDGAVIALAERLVSASRRYSEATRRLGEAEEAIARPKYPPVMLRQPGDSKLFSPPCKVGEPYTDKGWLDAELRNVAEFRRTHTAMEINEYCRARFARIEEIAAAAAAWEASEQALDDTFRESEISDEFDEAGLAKWIAESRLAARPSASFRGVLAKLSAVAESLDDEDNLIRIDDFDDMRLPCPMILLSAMRDCARLSGSATAPLLDDRIAEALAMLSKNVSGMRD